MKTNEFKPKQWVLVRDAEDEQWALARYSHYNKIEDAHAVLWDLCIPYDGNEYLLGTTDPYVGQYQPKDGDFVTLGKNDGDFILIYDESSEFPIGGYVVYNKVVRSLYNKNDSDDLTTKNLRPATEEEKQLLLFKMHEVGLDWDAENKKIVDLKWKPKEGEIVLIISYNEAHGRFIPQEWNYNPSDLKANMYNHGMMFNVSDDVDANSFADKLNEAIQNVK